MNEIVNIPIQTVAFVAGMLIMMLGVLFAKPIGNKIDAFMYRRRVRKCRLRVKL